MTVREVILLNGPPRSGKDTGATFLEDYFAYGPMHASRVKFSDPLKAGTHAAWGMAGRDINYYEDVKELPNTDFGGLTPREAYIDHAEKYMKELYGHDIYGKIAVASMHRSGSEVITVPDSGFPEEAEVVVKTFGAEHVLLLKLWRKGCDFSNDSRNYITLPTVYTDWVENNGSLDDYRNKVVHAYRKWIER